MRNRTICNEQSTFKRSSAFPFRGREVYTSVERIHCSPLRVDGSRGNAGHSLFGAEGLLYGPSEAGGQRRRRIRTVSQPLLLSPQRMSAERKQTPQVVESHRSR